MSKVTVNSSRKLNPDRTLPDVCCDKPIKPPNNHKVKNVRAAADAESPATTTTVSPSSAVNIEITRDYQVDRRCREDVLNDVQGSGYDEESRSLLENYLWEIVR